jgi:hypothetical protein
MIFSKEDIESEEAWKKFIETESWKIWENTDAYDAIFVLSVSKLEMDLIIITSDKISKIRFCKDKFKVFRENKTFNSRL